jgi:hypothetical protein
MKRWLNFLPWAAAVSLAAFAASAVYASWGWFALFHLIFSSAHRLPAMTTMLPAALAACLVVGVPPAIWFRASRAVAAALLVVMIGAVVVGILSLVANYYQGATGEAAGILTIIAVFWILPVGATLLAPAALLVFVSLPTGTLVLWLSGEMKAIRRRVSILDLPRGRLRVGLLAALTVAPALAYAPLPRLLHGEVYEACRTVPTPGALQYRGLQLFVDLDTPAWPELKRIAEGFAADHSLRLLPSDSFKRDDPFHYRLCAPGNFTLFFYTTQDYGAPSLVFEPTGEKFVAIMAFVAGADEGAGTAMRELATAIDARWPGVRLQTKMDLGPSLKPERPGTDVCRTKVVRPQYQDCLGTRAPATVNKEALYVHAAMDQPLGLREVLRTFAEAHGMAYTLEKNQHALGRACAKGKALIVTDPLAGPRLPVHKPYEWNVEIDTYLADERDGPLIDELRRAGRQMAGGDALPPGHRFLPCGEGAAAMKALSLGPTWASPPGQNSSS